MIIKEYFGVEICCVQSDMPYLHLWVLNKLLRRLCDKVCLKIIYKCIYYRVLHKIQFGESAVSSKKFISSFRKRCSNTYSKWVASSFGHKLGSKFRRFRASKNYNTINIQCVERLLLGVAYGGSLLIIIERGIHSV